MLIILLNTNLLFVVLNTKQMKLLSLHEFLFSCCYAIYCQIKSSQVLWSRICSKQKSSSVLLKF